jgi:shikimate dehydrogenase
VNLFGLIGDPVGHSISPAMMNAAFRAQGEPAVYLPFRVDAGEVEIALGGLRAIGAKGVNVTIPHKIAAFNWVGSRTREAVAANAVNTIRFDQHGSVGHNTDVSGWWRSIADAVPEGPVDVAILGAGGSVQAILTALSMHRPEAVVEVIARNAEAVSRLQAHFADSLNIRHAAWEKRADAVAKAWVVVQCTPIGMWPRVDEAAIDDAGVFQPGQVVQDIVYRPLETRFLACARSGGARVIDGATMLIGQGVDAYEWWLGREAPADVMASTVYEALRKEQAL